MNNRIKINDNLFIERKKNDFRSDNEIIKNWLTKKHNSKRSIKAKEQMLRS